MFNFGPIFDGMENYPKTTMVSIGGFGLFVAALMTKHFGFW